MLPRRHRESVRAGDVLVEAGEFCRRVVQCNLAPELGPEPRDEIDAAHGRPRLSQGRDRGYELWSLPRLFGIEFQIGVSCGSESEDPTLRIAHEPESGSDIRQSTL